MLFIAKQQRGWRNRFQAMVDTWPALARPLPRSPCEGRKKRHNSTPRGSGLQWVGLFVRHCVWRVHVSDDRRAYSVDAASALFVAYDRGSRENSRSTARAYEYPANTIKAHAWHIRSTGRAASRWGRRPTFCLRP